MTDAEKVMNLQYYWERSGRHPDLNPNQSGNLDSNPESLLVEVRRLGGGLRCLSTVYLRLFLCY